MSRQAISEAIMDTCEALIYALRNCIKMPSTAEEWRSVSDEFRVLHNFYNCIGAVNGKHVKIKRPNGSGALYYNYKGTYSIVLMAIAMLKRNLSWLILDAMDACLMVVSCFTLNSGSVCNKIV
ncbi:PREDICTED: uncharacterized protein LOC108381435 [Rhagoletis zephyria]|uniref:uncharacterized protein LOC108381435 n=1 Tax=Rhagoletis zephyria TaxID=28612 RepID=UPI0008119960|nr:PREDICTED: uncharacterized protein LOC108381435 [Rhagoletis zephyria]